MQKNEMRRLITGFFFVVILVVSDGLFCQEEYEIEVLGKKIPLTFDIKRGVLVIEGKYLQDLPAGNLPQLLSFAANMNFVNRGYFQADPQVMGFNQEQIVVMVNGAPFNNAQTGHHNFTLPLDIDQIERIEILRGGYSSLSGSSGTGGLINIITAGQNSLKIMRSSFDTARYSLNLGSKQAYISAGYIATDGHLPGTDGSKTFMQTGAKLSLAGNYFDVWGGWVRSKFGATNFYAPFPSFERLQRFLGNINMNRELSRSFSLAARLSTQYSQDEFTLFREDPDYYLNKHKSQQNTLDVGFRNAGKDFSSYFGCSFYWDNIDSRGIRSGVSTLALGHHTRAMYAVFGEISGERKKVFINSGFRLNFGVYADFSAQGLLGVWIGKDTKLSSSVYRTFRLPTYTELYYSDAAHNANPELKPENSVGTSLAFEQLLSEVEWGLRLFYNRSRRLIDWRWHSGDNIWISENVHSGIYYGMDAKFSYTMPAISCKLLYTWQNTAIAASASSGTLKYHYYFPEHSLTFILQRDIKVVSINTALKMEVEEMTRKARAFLNIRATKTWGKVKLYGEVLNIFNHQLEKIAGLPEAPRSYSAGIKFIF